MNEIRFCEFVDHVCDKMNEGGTTDDIRQMANELCKEIYKKKKSETKEKNREEILKTIHNSFCDIPPSSSLQPKDEDFLTFHSCVHLLKKTIDEEKHSQKTQVCLTIWRGKTIERIRKLKKVKITKMKKFLEDEIGVDLSRASVFLAVKLFKLSTRFPKLLFSTLSLYFIQKHFSYLQDYLEEEYHKDRAQKFDELTDLTQEMDDIKMDATTSSSQE